MYNFIALRGWVGEDKRREWVYTHNHPSTAENQMINMNEKKIKKEDELIEPIKEWTVRLGDRV